MNKALFTGAGGMLGNGYASIAAEYQSQLNMQFILTDRHRSDTYIDHILDVNNKEQFNEIISVTKPNYIFHLAAITSLEECESNPTDAYNTNTLSAKVAIDAAKTSGAFLVFISTAGVHDGKNTFYKADAKANPISIYGQTKWQAEVLIEESLDPNQYLILRAGWMMGGGIKHDKKFIAKIMKKLISGERTIYAVNNLYGSPTYTIDFAHATLRLLANKAFGKVNVCTLGSPSRLDVAKEICIWYSKYLNQKIQVIPVDSSYFQTEYFAQRPEHESMDLTNFNDLVDPRSWKSALNEYLETSWRDIITL